MRFVGRVADTVENRTAYGVLVGNTVDEGATWNT
jgi:hypothetical protein